MNKDLLTITKQICRRLRIPEPSTVVSNTDRNIIEILQLIEESGRDIRDQYEWPELQSEYTFTLTSGTANYALPNDLNFILFNTLWDRANTWPLIGPVSPQEWQERKSGIVTALPRKGFRVKGFGASQFYLDPTPAAGDTGATLVLEYCNTSWIKPATAWAASTVLTLNSYIYTNQNVYKVTTGGTSGTSQPTGNTPTDGTAVLLLTAYDTPLADTDLIVLNADTLMDRVEWRWKQSNGFEYEALEQAWKGKLDSTKTDLSSASPVSFRRPRINSFLLGPWNVPDSGFGS